MLEARARTVSGSCSPQGDITPCRHSELAAGHHHTSILDAMYLSCSSPAFCRHTATIVNKMRLVAPTASTRPLRPSILQLLFEKGQRLSLNNCCSCAGQQRPGCGELIEGAASHTGATSCGEQEPRSNHPPPHTLRSLQFPPASENHPE